MIKRKIAVVTGTRAEYGLLYGLMKEIQADPELELQIIVTGMHLSPEFGLTYRLIEQDGFHIDEKVDMLLSGDSPAAVTKSLGIALIGLADTYARLTPQIIVVLGDRIEALAAAQAAMVARIPIAHLHGGELTEGAIDDAIRHSITKMAHLHFVAAEPYRQRVIRLGESPDRIYNFGAPGIENLKRIKHLTRDELEQSLNCSIGPLLFLVTYHPVTLEEAGPEQAIQALLRALDRFPEATILFTKPNSDTDGRIIIEVIEQYARQQPDRIKVYASMGQINYLSALSHCDAVIGNSSSGIIEAPFFKKPTVNIGKRQEGRLKASSIIDCDETAEAIEQAIQLALNPEYKCTLNAVVSLYGEGATSKQIKEILKQVDLERILFKQFYDM